MKNKVLLLCPVYYPYPAGGAQSFPLVAEVLSSKYYVMVLTEFHPKKPLKEKYRNLEIFRILPVRDNFGKKTLLYSLISYLLTYLIIYLFSIFNILSGLTYFHFTRYFGYPMLPLLAFLKIFGVKSVYDCRTGNNQKKFNKLYARTFKFCDFAIANSMSALKLIQENSEKNFPKYLIETPLKLPKPIYKKEIEINGYKFLRKKYILCIGTISERKSTLKILESYLMTIEKITKENNKLFIPDLIFVGRNDLGKKFLKCLSRSIKLLYIGDVSHYESLLLTANSYGSINASSCEGIPRSSLEALNFNIPSILSGAVPEFVEFCNNSCIHNLENSFEKNLSTLIFKLIIDPGSFELINNKYPLYQHNFKFFKKKLLDLYSK